MRIISKIEIRIRRLVWRLPKRTLLLLICILIGIVAGISAFLLKSLLQNLHNFIILQTIKIEKLVARINNKWIRVRISGVLLSALIFILPSLFCEGDFSIQSI